MLDDELLLGVGLARSWEELRDTTVAVANSLGFGLASGVRIVGRLSSGKASVQSFGNPPEGFAEASKSLDLSLRDPFLGALMARPGFVSYDKDFYAHAGAGDLADLLEPWGYRYGMGISMHDQGEVFSFGMDSADVGSRSELQRLEERAMLQLLTMHAQAAARHIAHGVRPPVELTAEERECLSWEAAGSIWRAGEVLHLSDAQLGSIAASATRKLGAATARGAAVVAIRSGLIRP